jgi:hypothetical protein
MAKQNLNLVLKNLCAANAGKQGRDAVAGVLGQTMPPALSQGRPMSPGFTAFEPTLAEHRHVHGTYRRVAKRVGRSAASLPGNPVRSRFWRELVTGATTTRTGITASSDVVSGRGLSDWCERHHNTSGHDYPSHDRRDDQRTTRTGQQQPVGSAPITNRGK